MRVTFASRHLESANVITHFFRPERPIHYMAGQFIELTLPHDNPDDRGAKRWFTLSSSPTDELLSITTKFTIERGSTFKQALRDLTVGTQLEISDPMGDFVLPKDISRPLIFVAGGIGLTPFHSMVSWLVAAREKRDITFLYSVQNKSEIFFQDTFAAAGIQPVIVVSGSSKIQTNGTKHLDAKTILGLGQPVDDALIYISGPEPMTEALEADLKSHGIQDSQLVLDFFHNYENIYTN